MRSALSLGVLLALVAAGLAGAAEHEQATLQLEYVPQPVLEATSGSVAVSPTGRNLYVLGGIDNRTRLAVFGRDPQTGRLWRPAGPAGCFRAWYVHARDCGNVPGLNNSFAIAVSPDARDVAIGAYAAPQLAFLRREDSGGLRYRSCLGEPVGTFRCGVIRGLDGVEDVAFSPDGRNLYIAARQDHPGLLVLGRDRATGAVQQLRGESGCLQRDGRKQPERRPARSSRRPGTRRAWCASRRTDEPWSRTRARTGTETGSSCSVETRRRVRSRRLRAISSWPSLPASRTRLLVGSRTW